jgi:hypothetical protein
MQSSPNPKPHPQPLFSGILIPPFQKHVLNPFELATTSVVTATAIIVITTAEK